MVLSDALMSCVFLPFRVGYLLAKVLYDIKNVTYPMHLNKYVHFLCSPKENEPKEKAPGHLVLRTSLHSSILPGIYKLAEFMPEWVLKQCKFLFRQYLRCSAA